MRTVPGRGSLAQQEEDRLTKSQEAECLELMNPGDTLKRVGLGTPVSVGSVALPCLGLAI